MKRSYALICFLFSFLLLIGCGQPDMNEQAAAAVQTQQPTEESQQLEDSDVEVTQDETETSDEEVVDDATDVEDVDDEVAVDESEEDYGDIV